MNGLVKLLASGLGSGYMPFASGTWASAAAMGLYWLLFPHGGTAAAVAVAAIAVGIPISTRAEKLYGMPDDSRIVIDEFAGYWVSVAFLPFSPKTAVAAFLLFRLFDVVKPLFIKRIQVLPGGWGIVLDDVCAGLFANLTIRGAMALLK